MTANHMSTTVLDEKVASPAIGEMRWRCERWFKMSRGLLLLFLLNLITTSIVAVAHDKTPADALNYYYTAFNLYRGQGFSRNFKIDVHDPETVPPFAARGRFLYPYLVSFSFHVFGPSVNTANLVSALFKSLLVLPLFYLARELFGQQVGITTVLLFTLNPFYFSLGLVPMPETTCDFFYYLAIMALVMYGHRQRRRWLVLASASASLAYLTRAEALLLLLLGLIVLKSFAAQKKDWLLFLVIPTLTLSLGSLRIYGRPLGLEYTSTPLVTLPDWWHYYSFKRFTWREYLNHVGGLRGAFQLRLYNYLRFAENVFSDGLLVDTGIGLLPAGFLPILVLPFFVHLPVKRKRLFRLLSGFMLIQVLINIGYPGYPRINTELRHGQLVAPFLLILAAVGLTQLLETKGPHIPIKPASHLGPWIAGVLGGGYVLFSGVFLTLILEHYLWSPPERGGIERGAEWARAELPRGSVLLSRKPNLAYHYSQHIAIVAPTASFQEIMKYAQRHQITHLLLSAREERRTPNLLQGVEIYAEFFHRVHTAEDFQIVQIRSYDFLADMPIVEGDEFVKKELDRTVELEWLTLLKLPRNGSIAKAWQFWRDFPRRLQQGTLRISKEIPRARRIQVETDFKLGQILKLKGYDLSVDVLEGRSTIRLSLYWQPLTLIREDYTVFIHVLGDDGQILGQIDSQPLHGKYPTSHWNMDDTVQDEYEISFTQKISIKDCQIAVGMYLPITGKRLPIMMPDGRRLSNDQILLKMDASIGSYNTQP